MQVCNVRVNPNAAKPTPVKTPTLNAADTQRLENHPLAPGFEAIAVGCDSQATKTIRKNSLR